MRVVLLVAVAFAPVVCLSAGAVYLAAHSISGWGWFLLAAVLLGGAIKVSDT